MPIQIKRWPQNPDPRNPTFLLGAGQYLGAGPWRYRFQIATALFPLSQFNTGVVFEANNDDSNFVVFVPLVAPTDGVIAAFVVYNPRTPGVYDPPLVTRFNCEIIDGPTFYIFSLDV